MKFFLAFLLAPVTLSATADSALFKAVEQGDLNLIKATLASGAHINARDSYDKTPLLHALFLRDEEYALFKHPLISVVRLLLDAGADPNASDRNGPRALDYAATAGKDLEQRKKILSLLLSRGANPELRIRSTTGQTSLTRLATGNPECIELFKVYRQHNISIDTPDGEGWTPLYWAAHHDNLELVAFLVKNGADINRRYAGGKTLLQLYIELSLGTSRIIKQQMVKMLLVCGADPGRKDNSGADALAQAMKLLPYTSKLVLTVLAAYGVKGAVDQAANVRIRSKYRRLNVYGGAYYSTPLKASVELGLLLSTDNDGEINHGFHLGGELGQGGAVVHLGRMMKGAPWGLFFTANISASLLYPFGEPYHAHPGHLYGGITIRATALVLALKLGVYTDFHERQALFLVGIGGGF